MLGQLPDLTTVAWVALVACAILIGISKTAIPGINTIGIAVFAAILPAKASTATVLLLLIVGDLIALAMYRRHADWPTLLRLIPSVLAGLAAGAIVLAFADDDWVRRLIGVLLLLVIAFTLWRRSPLYLRRLATPSAESMPSGERTPSDEPPPAERLTRPSRLANLSYGGLGGFTTMVANAAGPVMSMYFIAARFPVTAFLGTAAWFFAVINLVKVPIVASLGLLTSETLLLVLVLIPGVIVGAGIGRLITGRIKQRFFEWAVVIATVIGAVYLLL